MSKSFPLPDGVSRNTLRVEDVDIHYLEAGQGSPVLLLHGWPTSSYLWRNCMPPMAQGNRVIAMDLPGFGQSSKPLDASYSFRFFSRMLDGFLDQLGIDDVGLAVHDLGGPVGLYWAVNRRPRVSRLALLNTLVYPRPTAALLAFVLASKVPGMRSYLSSARGLKWAMELGLADKSNATDDLIAAVQAPFADDDARRVLLKNAHSLHPAGFREIADKLPRFDCPVRLIYGAKDRILPDVERTMTQVAADLPQADVTRFEDCGHFLQEERGAEIGRLLAEFFRAG